MLTTKKKRKEKRKKPLNEEWSAMLVTIHKLNNDVFTTLVRQLNVATAFLASQKTKEEEEEEVKLNNECWMNERLNRTYT